MARIRTGGFTIDAEIQHLAETEQALREVRKRLARGTDDEAVQAANLTILPTARSRAGNLKIAGSGVAESLLIRRIRGGARLTTRLRGVRARAVGLLEFGGTVRAPIRPNARHALMLRGGEHPVSIVRTPRHYRARKFMLGAREERLGAFAENLRDRLVRFFRELGFEVN